MEQVTEGSFFSFDTASLPGGFRGLQLQKVEVALLAKRRHPQGGEGQKEDCLFLTNEATMSLKTKGREN